MSTEQKKEIETKTEKKPSPELEKLITGMMHTYSGLLEEQQKEDILPPFEKQKVTQRWEYVRDRYGKRQGPYLYCY
jgi:glutaredoxin